MTVLSDALGQIAEIRDAINNGDIARACSTLRALETAVAEEARVELWRGIGDVLTAPGGGTSSPRALFTADLIERAQLLREDAMVTRLRQQLVQDDPTAESPEDDDGFPPDVPTPPDEEEPPDEGEPDVGPPAPPDEEEPDVGPPAPPDEEVPDVGPPAPPEGEPDVGPPAPPDEEVPEGGTPEQPTPPGEG